MSDAPARWGELIKRKRTGDGRTQKDVAAAVGVEQSQVSDWESGRYEPNMERQRCLVRTLGITSEELAALYGAPEPEGDVA